MRKPYYLESRDTWMVWLNGRQEKLGEGISEQEAYDRFDELREFYTACVPDLTPCRNGNSPPFRPRRDRELLTS